MSIIAVIMNSLWQPGPKIERLLPEPLGEARRQVGCTMDPPAPHWRQGDRGGNVSQFIREVSQGTGHNVSLFSF